MKAGVKKVIIEEINDEQQVGLYLGSSVADGIVRGKVIDINNDDLNSDVKNDDIVQVKKSFANQIKVDGKEYYVTNVMDILVVE